jgi:hypothetical protein
LHNDWLIKDVFVWLEWLLRHKFYFGLTLLPLGEVVRLGQCSLQRCSRSDLACFASGRRLLFALVNLFCWYILSDTSNKG